MQAVWFSCQSLLCSHRAPTLQKPCPPWRSSANSSKWPCSLRRSAHSSAWPTMTCHGTQSSKAVAASSALLKLRVQRRMPADSQLSLVKAIATMVQSCLARLAVKIAVAHWTQRLRRCSCLPSVQQKQMLRLKAIARRLMICKNLSMLKRRRLLRWNKRGRKLQWENCLLLMKRPWLWSETRTSPTRPKIALSASKRPKIPKTIWKSRTVRKRAASDLSEKDFCGRFHYYDTDQSGIKSVLTSKVLIKGILLFICILNLQKYNKF